MVWWGGGSLSEEALYPPYLVLPALLSLYTQPYALHPTPYTLHPAPYTLHPTPSTLQGYLACKKTHPPGILLWAYALGPRVVLGG